MHHNHNISTSSQTQSQPQFPHPPTPTQFQAVNSIYELQSIINRLSIEKQKNWINYTIAVKEQDQIIGNYQAVVGELQGRVGELEGVVGDLEEILEKERAEFGRVVGEKEGLERMMGVGIGDSTVLTVYSAIQDYKRIQKQLADSQQKITSLQQQLQAKQQQLQTQTNQSETATKTLQTKLQTLHQSVQTLQSENTQLQSLLTQSNTTHSEQQSQQCQQLQKLQSQLHTTTTQLNQYRRALCQVKTAYVNKEFYQVEMLERGVRDRDRVRDGKYGKLVAMYQDVLGNVERLGMERAGLEKDLVVVRQACGGYQQEIGVLNGQVCALKQLVDKMRQQILDLEMHQQQRPIHNDNLAKLEQISYEYNKQSKRLSAEVEELTKINAKHVQNIGSKDKEIVGLQERNKCQGLLLETLQSTIKSLSQQLQTRTEQKNTLIQTTQSLQQKLSSTQLQLHLQLQSQSQSHPSPSPPSPSPPSPSPQLSPQLLQKLQKTQKQNSNLLKQTITLKQYIIKIEAQLMEQIGKNCQQEYQIFQIRRKLDIVRADKEELGVRVEKLGRMVEEGRKEGEEERRKFMGKMQVLKECNDKLHQSILLYSKQYNNKLNALTTTFKTYNIKLQPQPTPIPPSITPTPQIPQTTSLQVPKPHPNPLLKIFPKPESTSTTINKPTKITQKNIPRNKQDEDLDRIIKDLKNLNKSMIVGVGVGTSGGGGWRKQV